MNRLRTLTLIAGIGAALTLHAGTAVAQEFGGPFLQPLVGVGLTVGGDKIISNIQYDDGASEDLQAGQFFQLYGGVRYQGVPQFSVQATFGYHADQTRAASNGSARFVRYPLEVLGHYHLDDQVHIGGGVRIVTGARISADGLLAELPGMNRSFKQTIGMVVEAEYFLSPQVGVKLRAVSEQYEADDGSADKLDGSHVGVMLTWYL